MLTLLTWFGGWIVRRRFHAPLVMTRAQKRWRLASRLGVVLLLAMMLGWVHFVATGLDDSNDALARHLTVLYVIGVLAELGAVAMLVEAVLRVARGPGGWLVRLGEVLLGLSGLYALWGILAYGLANFNYTF